MRRKGWGEFFFYLVRVFILLALLAYLLPKFVSVCDGWLSSLGHDEQKPSGNPMRVDNDIWSKSAIHIFTDSPQ